MFAVLLPQMASSNTTKKHASFLSTPLAEITSLNLVPGVGPVTLNHLLDAGIVYPYQLVGQYMLLGRDTARMKEWLKQACSVRAREAEVIVEALQEKTARICVL
jgi:predicted flap endonuclease-1-like 5' DNA nuclease